MVLNGLVAAAAKPAGRSELPSVSMPRVSLLQNSTVESLDRKIKARWPQELIQKKSQALRRLRFASRRFSRYNDAKQVTLNELMHVIIWSYFVSLSALPTSYMLVYAILAQPLRCLLSVVRQNNVSASTTEAQKRLKRNRLLV